MKFRSNWSQSQLERNWAGPEYWTNPLQAWQQKEGKLHCVASGGDRNIVSLVTEIGSEPLDFFTTVNIEKLYNSGAEENTGWVGFQIGKKGEFRDYRDDAVKGVGLSAGWNADGQLFIGDLSRHVTVEPIQGESFSLKLKGKTTGEETYEIELQLLDQGGKLVGTHVENIHSSWLEGLVALTCSTTYPDTLDYSVSRPPIDAINELKKQSGGKSLYAFSGWKIGGGKVTIHPDRAYGPILWTQHTLSDNILKMNVQMAPIGNDQQQVSLIVDDAPMSTVEINPQGYVAQYKIVNWNSTIDHPYRIEYTSNDGQLHSYEGVIKKNPVQPIVKLASLSCVDDIGFPHQDLVDNLSSHQADLYAFHGDQLYERVGGYGVERNSELDYLRKWYMWGWTFRDLIRDHPTIIIPDDHDVFHGNLWGEGGKRANVSKGYGYDSQDGGGYKEPPSFVNMVHLTQTGHLPDPSDRRPVSQGISVYYTNMNYGGVSYAILSDRQWKSAPKPLFPEAEIENGWPQNTSWNPKTEAFSPRAQLLGPRQEQFLNAWVGNWAPGIIFKTVISQSPFCNVSTLPKDIYHDKHVPSLPRYKKGEYPPDDRPVADFDSNGWPKNKRDEALSIIRKAFALHITGDQHLGSTGQYGIDRFGDAGYWVSTPAVSNLWPRRWFPSEEAKSGKRSGDTRRYTGDYEDGFGNKMTIKAVANPYDIDKEPGKIYDKAPGYSIIDFDRTQRRISISVWPRWAAPGKSSPDNQPYQGWPIFIDQWDNLRHFEYNLEEMTVDGNTLIKVYRRDDSELIYTFKPLRGSFKPPVPEKTKYYILTFGGDGSKRMISDLDAS